VKVGSSLALDPAGEALPITRQHTLSSSTSLQTQAAASKSVFGMDISRETYSNGLLKHFERLLIAFDVQRHLNAKMEAPADQTSPPTNDNEWPKEIVGADWGRYIFVKLAKHQAEMVKNAGLYQETYTIYQEYAPTPQTRETMRRVGYYVLEVSVSGFTSRLFILVLDPSCLKILLQISNVKLDSGI
jgi:hypothetical protein